MLALSFRFPGGRYHATPWGHHVNEAEVEWPPSPWRILRALIATWHLKADPAAFPEPVLESLIERLAASLPVYRLPAAVRAHSRHYMPTRDKPTLVFDAFVHVDREAELVAAWPDVSLGEDEQALLSVLLRDLGFLGRAESWVDASLLAGVHPEADCVPSGLGVDPGTGELSEPVRLIAPLPADRYRSWRQEAEAQIDWQEIPSRRRAALRATLPERLIEALRLETADVQAGRWSQPPGAIFVTYRRPYGCLAPEPARWTRPTPGPVSSVRLGLAGRPLPRIEDAVRIGELVRRAAMSRAQALSEGREVPAELSGHDLPRSNRHAHAFYLPEDADRDGRIDHVLVHATGGLSSLAVRALASIDRLWERGGGEWQVLFESSGSEAAGLSALGAASRHWVSVTPYLRPWFRKRGFDVPEQIARECLARGLPAPRAIRTRAHTDTRRGRRRRAVHFRRFRDRRGLVQPDSRGTFVEIDFPESVTGPLALGFGCHFGLGMFRPR